MKEYVVPGHAPSLLPDGDFTLVWSDEFDGDTLDRTKWDYRLSMMGERWPAWVDRGVHLQDSCAVFTLTTEDGRPVSAQLQTGYNFMDEPVTPPKSEGQHLRWSIGKLRRSLYLHRYGYYECRCRLQQKPGWWSAFWMQSPVIGCSPDPAEAGIEQDIMESFRPGTCSQHANHFGGYGVDHGCVISGKGREDLDPAAFHTFGLLWTPRGYTYYIDGEEDGHTEAPVSHRPEFILISTEVNGYRQESHTPTAEAYAAVGDTFAVDHVRVFDLMRSR